MSRWFQNVFHLGLKEISSLARDVVMVVLIVYAFTIAIYVVATGRKTEVRNASIAIVDADQSTLSGRIKDALQPPYFQNPREIDRSEVDVLMDKGRYTFILEIPPRFEADLLARKNISVAMGDRQSKGDYSALAYCRDGTGKTPGEGY